jgi:uncharacterized protein involved in exopolysaccharide biosynthesis
MSLPEPAAIVTVQDELTLVDVVRFLRRRWTLILAVAILGGATVAAYLIISYKPVFSATALISLPHGPGVKSKRVPPNAVAMRALADGSTVAHSLQKRMECFRKDTDPETYLLRSRLLDASLPTTLELTADSQTAELAAAAANAWAEAFVERLKAIIAESAADYDKQLKGKLGVINDEIAELQKQREAIAPRYEQALDKVFTEYRMNSEDLLGKTEERLNAKRAEEAEAIARYNAEGEKAFQALQQGQQLQSKRFQLEGARRTYVGSWERLCAPDPGERITEERRRLEQIASACGAQIEKLVAEISAEERKETAFERERLDGREKLRIRYAAEAAQIQVARDASMNGLQCKRDGQLQALSTAFNEQFKLADAAIAACRNRLSETIREDSNVVTVSPDNVWVLEPAVPPAQPQSRSIAKQIALAVFAGLFLGLLTAVVVEVFRQTSQVKE